MFEDVLLSAGTDECGDAGAARDLGDRLTAGEVSEVARVAVRDEESRVGVTQLVDALHVRLTGGRALDLALPVIAIEEAEILLERRAGFIGERPGFEPGPAQGQLGGLNADQAHGNAVVEDQGVAIGNAYDARRGPRFQGWRRRRPFFV